jgi:hypothetical protein
MDWPFLKKLLLAWLAVPLTALDWAIAWHKLPERVVMKTGTSGAPIAWASPAAAMKLNLTALAGVLGVMTVVGVLVALGAPWKASQIGNVVLFMGVFMFVLMNGVLWFMHVP